MISYTPQFKHKNNQKVSFNCAERCWMLYVPMWRHQQRLGAAKLTTDSYQFWVAHYNLRVTFQSHIRFARKVQKYGDAFSKSSSICFMFAFVMMSCKFLAGLWYPVGNLLTSWLTCVWCFYFTFCKFPISEITVPLSSDYANIFFCFRHKLW